MHLTPPPSFGDAPTSPVQLHAAAHAANAVEKDRLYQNEHRRAAETNALIELGKTLTHSLEIEPIFTTAHQMVTRIMPCEAFYISLRDAQSRSTSVTHLIDIGLGYRKCVL